MDGFLEGGSRAVSFLLASGIMLVCWAGAYDFTKKERLGKNATPLMAYGKIILGVVLFSYIIFMLVDMNEETTQKEVVEGITFYILIGGIPALIGVRRALKD